MPSNEILAPSHRSDQQHVRQGHDYQHVTVGEGSRAILGNVYADNFSMNIVDPSQRPRKTEQEKKEDFMKTLGSDVMDSRLATIGIAHRDTCSWLYTRTEYLRWQDPGSRAEHHGFLWIKGKPGAGKSTLMKHALHHAQSIKQMNITILSFFFNARGQELEKTTEGMYRSLLHQVFKTCSDRLPGIVPSHSSDPKDNSWQLPILQTMLREALLNFGNTTEFICYIDALDECAEDDIRLAVEYFEELGELAASQNTRISICFASRHYPNITMRRYQALNLDEQGEHHEDIRKFVEAKLHGTGRTHSELGAEISGKSSGVFLWAALVVQILNKKMDQGASRPRLMADLKAVPTGIGDLLKSILMDGSMFLLPTLLWVLYSYEPLSASDLHFAVMTGAGLMTSEDWDQAETTKEQMHLFVLNSSKGLVEFSKDKSARAQFIHESVREYLLNGGLSELDDSLAEDLGAKSHHKLAMWCRNCIQLGLHRNPDDEKTEGVSLFLDYALNYLYSHCEDAYMEGAFDWALLDNLPQSVQAEVCEYAELNDWENLAATLIQMGHESLLEGLLLRQLRRSSNSGSGQGNAGTTTRINAIEEKIPLLNINTQCDAEHSTILLSAINRQSRKLVELLLDCGADPDLAYPESEDVTVPLFAALEIGNFEIAELLLHHGANPNIIRRRSGTTETPLVMAMALPSTRFVGMLLEGGADPNSVSPGDALPLLIALEIRDYDCAELLLHYGADPNITSTYNGATQSPLAMAISQRSTRCVEVLLQHGADANGCGAELGRPLTDAIETDQQEIVRMLLDRGADASGCGAKRETPLTAAIFRGQQEAVAILLQHGADANGGRAELGNPLTDAISSHPCLQEIVHLLLAHRANPDGTVRKRPLHLAVERRDESTVRLLLDAGADIKAKDEMNRSPLHMLCSGGKCPLRDSLCETSSIRKALLDAGADVNASDSTTTTALTMAAEMGSPSLERFLIDRDAKKNTTDMTHRMALTIAARTGDFGPAQLLIKDGTDINATDSARKTALVTAVEMGDPCLVRLLLDAGADTNATDSAHRKALIVALVVAAKMGNLDIARLLVDRGANLDMYGQEAHYLRFVMADRGIVFGSVRRPE
jgi:ankyrin repeat protein